MYYKILHFPYRLHKYTFDQDHNEGVQMSPEQTE